MEVIVLERVGRWKIGDVVDVKDGFARNYLFPRKKALRATTQNKEKFAHEKIALEERNTERKTQAAVIAADLDGKRFSILRQAGEAGQLYGSVSPRDIALAMAESGFSVEKNHIVLESPIKSIGIHTAHVALHPEVVVSIGVNVARSAEEAEAQARGESFVGSASDREEARLHAEALLAEIHEHAQDRME